MLHSLRHLAHSAKKVAHPCSTRCFQHSRGGNDDQLALCWLLFSLVMIMYKLHIDNKGMRSRAGIPYETALRDVNIYCTHHALLLISYHYFNTDRPKLRDGDKKNKKKKVKWSICHQLMWVRLGFKVQICSVLLWGEHVRGFLRPQVRRMMKVWVTSWRTNRHRYRDTKTYIPGRKTGAAMFQNLNTQTSQMCLSLL